MKKILTLILLLLPIIIFSQDVRIKKINSRLLNSERFIKIHIPENYKIDSTKLYPIAIVLDADQLFDVYVANSKLFASKDEAPEQIVVGIVQNNFRERSKNCSYNEDNGLPSVDGADFFNFIKVELIPYIEENFRTSPFKTIVGNGLTANFSNYFLVENYPSFNGFITINPYFAPNMPGILNSKVNKLVNENVYYYLSNGRNNSEKIQTSINDTNNLLDSIPNPKFKYKYEAFSNTQTAVIGQSIPGAIAFIFEPYSAISNEEFEKNIKDLSPPDAIAYLENKYVEIEYLFGSNLKIREKDIYAIEDIVMDKENGDYLKMFGEMINKLYEESPIGDYYIGRYYETGKNYRMALRYYKTGYMKLPKGDPNEDGYYENIRRVLDKRSGFIDDSTPEEIKDAETIKDKK